MPELSDEGKANIALHIKSKLDKKCLFSKCPVCRSKNPWVYPETVVELREFAYGSFGQQMVPVVPVTCQICGYMLLFNAIHAQVIKPPTQIGKILKELGAHE